MPMSAISSKHVNHARFSNQANSKLPGMFSLLSPTASQAGLSSSHAAMTQHHLAPYAIFCYYFRDLRVPVRLRIDGGPQFMSREFTAFLDLWGVRHIVISPHYPQSNGHIESAVKSVKHLILKVTSNGNIDCEEFDRSLLELRNTPYYTGRSPAHI
ncbi:uncharacterized protein LOC125036150 [Penaeus chinensis]|uniref:uncharacterized protein LOC125036150 n=1 Tax=Penaeus chinensis TaxID=139456 RepID=UPI001FB5BCD0|nr:uncharacterized protein LOC125036150 [Penaeus chinensis]